MTSRGVTGLPCRDLALGQRGKVAGEGIRDSFGSPALGTGEPEIEPFLDRPGERDVVSFHGLDPHGVETEYSRALGIPARHAAIYRIGRSTV